MRLRDRAALIVVTGLLLLEIGPKSLKSVDLPELRPIFGGFLAAGGTIANPREIDIPFGVLVCDATNQDKLRPPWVPGVILSACMFNDNAIIPWKNRVESSLKLICFVQGTLRVFADMVLLPPSAVRSANGKAERQIRRYNSRRLPIVSELDRKVSKFAGYSRSVKFDRAIYSDPWAGLLFGRILGSFSEPGGLVNSCLKFVNLFGHSRRRSFGSFSLITSGNSQSMSIRGLFSDLIKLLSNQAEHLIGLLTAPLHLSKLTLHSVQLAIVNNCDSNTNENCRKFHTVLPPWRLIGTALLSIVLSFWGWRQMRTGNGAWWCFWIFSFGVFLWGYSINWWLNWSLGI